jgi:hypothetical protein
LPEYKFKWKSILGAILPIALSVFLPGIGTAIGTALGATGTMASALGSAVIGGATGALTGGGLKGALTGAALGGIGGGFGQMAGGALSEGLGLGLSNTMQGVLGGGLLGAGVGAISGGGKGALMGALTGGIGSGLNAYMSGGSGSSGDFMQADYDQLVAQGLAAPGQNISGAGGATGATGAAGADYMQADYDQLVSQGLAEPGQTFGGSALTNIAKATAGSTASPSKSIIDSMKSGLSGFFGGTKAPATGTAASSGFGFGDILKYAPLVMTAGSLLSGPPEVKEAVATLSPDQQEYFNRPSISWDWDKLQADANNANMSLQQFMASNWNNITKGNYNAAPTTVAQAQPETMQMARGGLSQVAYLARGAGTGRSDEIPARLSDGEYVMDAETVAMIGDGSTDAGAKRLDKMRSDLRKHKGKSLAKGKFSPDAKSPLSYLKGVA